MSARRNRPYTFYDTAISVCSTCLMRCEAKIVFEDERVMLHKWCRQHGHERVLIADDVEYWRTAREKFIRPAEMPKRFETRMEWGCPYDCGLCPDHQQHGCLVLVEINDHCNLTCPICYAGSGVHRMEHKDMATIEAMLDAAVRSEGEPDIVQISGGEPTIHPQFFDVLDAARARPIKHLMINTNGLRLAKDPAFAERLATYMPGFEVYLQFDSLRDDVLMQLRGARLSKVREQALEALDRHGISTTLVVTLAKGLNDDELGEILEYALKWKCVRGVTIQPIQEVGRLEGYDPGLHRLTLTEVRRRLVEQWPRLSAQDMVPVPCHPDALSMAYGLKLGEHFTPLTRYLEVEDLLEGGGNTISFEHMPELRDKLMGIFSTGIGPEGQATKLSELLCCLPKVQAPGLTYENVFRVVIMQFMDARDFDVHAAKRCCVHFAQPDGKLIPFDTFNLFYRDGKRAELEAIRKRLDKVWESE